MTRLVCCAALLAAGCLNFGIEPKPLLMVTAELSSNSVDEGTEFTVSASVQAENTRVDSIHVWYESEVRRSVRRDSMSTTFTAHNSGLVSVEAFGPGTRALAEAVLTVVKPGTP